MPSGWGWEKAQGPPRHPTTPEPDVGTCLGARALSHRGGGGHPPLGEPRLLATHPALTHGPRGLEKDPHLHGSGPQRVKDLSMH